MKIWLKALATACVFLTRIPMPRMAQVLPEDEGRALLCFPLVGLLVGGLLWGIATLSLTAFSAPVTAAVVLVCWTAITGGLHLDGLADSADGWLGGCGDPQRTLEIMRDSRCGSGALIVVCCLLILKFAALQVVVEHRLWTALIVAPVIGRCSGPLLFIPGKIFYTPYIQASGIAKHFIDHCPPQARIVAWAAVATCGLLLGLSLRTIAVLSICALTLLSLRHLMIQRLGGATGDTAGAATEILETVLLLVCGALLT